MWRRIIATRGHLFVLFMCWSFDANWAFVWTEPTAIDIRVDYNNALEVAAPTRYVCRYLSDEVAICYEHVPHLVEP